MNIMIDLETLGTRPGSAIMSVGCVGFDKGGVKSFYHSVFSRSGMAISGMTEDRSTVDWWYQQKDYTIVEQSTRSDEPVRHTLTRLSAWFHLQGTIDGVWGNGSDFDNVLLAAVYRTCGVVRPWDFRKNRCYRTLKNLYPNIQGGNRKEHDALADATDQTEHLFRILAHMGVEP